MITKNTPCAKPYPLQHEECTKNRCHILCRLCAGVDYPNGKLPFDTICCACGISLSGRNWCCTGKNHNEPQNGITWERCAGAPEVHNPIPLIDLEAEEVKWEEEKRQRVLEAQAKLVDEGPKPQPHYRTQAGNTQNPCHAICKGCKANVVGREFLKNTYGADPGVQQCCICGVMTEEYGLYHPSNWKAPENGLCSRGSKWKEPQ